MKNKKDKPTMKMVSDAIGTLVQENYKMSDFLRRLDSTLGAYIEYKKDADGFKEWLQSEIEKEQEKTNESNPENLGKSTTGDRETKIRSIKSEKDKTGAKTSEK